MSVSKQLHGPRFVKKLESIFHSPHIFVVFGFVGCVVFLTAGMLLKTSSHQRIERPPSVSNEEFLKALKPEQIKITNKTAGFNLIKVEKTERGDISLTFRNDFPKKIVAYQYSYGNGISFGDYTFSEREDGIAPGALETRLLANQSDPLLLKEGIVVLAVAFEDWTLDGDPRTANEILEYLKGGRKALEKALALLQDAQSVKMDVATELNRVKSGLMVDFKEQGGARPSEYESGLRDATEIIMFEVDRVSKHSPPEKMREDIGRLILRYRQIREKR